jgi:cytochrome c biogenesis protein CcmG/thiol:disulfide interchange protein DsbE
VRRWLPLAGFGLLLALLVLGLWHAPGEAPSPLIGRPAPAFSLPVLGRPGEVFAPAQVQGRPWLLHVWAPWCRTCLQEHQFLLELARAGVPLYGLNWRDANGEAAALLGRLGNPYRRCADDRDGRVGLDWGVAGVPETYLIDAEGRVRAKHAGPLNARVWTRKLAPLLEGRGT